MKFLVFAASHRPESYNRKLAVHAAHYLGAKGMQADFAEYREFDMPLYNDTLDVSDATSVFGRRAASAHGIIISAPEYNWSYPGSLKNIIDWTSCMNPNPIKGRTVLLMSASPGPRGGILGMNHLKAPFESQQLFVFNRAFALGNCERFFDSSDRLDASQGKILNAMLDDYVTFTGKVTNS